jgi:hypothetical protein
MNNSPKKLDRKVVYESDWGIGGSILTIFVCSGFLCNVVFFRIDLF